MSRLFDEWKLQRQSVRFTPEDLKTLNAHARKMGQPNQDLSKPTLSELLRTIVHNWCELNRKQADMLARDQQANENADDTKQETERHAQSSNPKQRKPHVPNPGHRNKDRAAKRDHGRRDRTRAHKTSLARSVGPRKRTKGGSPASRRRGRAKTK